MKAYPRPKKKSAYRRFKENFEFRELAYQIAFALFLMVCMFLFLWFCFTIKGPTWGYL